MIACYGVKSFGLIPSAPLSVFEPCRKETAIRMHPPEPIVPAAGGLRDPPLRTVLDPTGSELIEHRL